MIATTRETVNRTLNRFWDEKLLDMRTSHVVVVDSERCVPSYVALRSAVLG